MIHGCLVGITPTCGAVIFAPLGLGILVCVNFYKIIVGLQMRQKEMIGIQISFVIHSILAPIHNMISTLRR